MVGYRGSQRFYCLLRGLNIDAQTVLDGSRGSDWANARDHNTWQCGSEIVRVEERGEVLDR